MSLELKSARSSAIFKVTLILIATCAAWTEAEVISVPSDDMSFSEASSSDAEFEDAVEVEGLVQARPRENKIKPASLVEALVETNTQLGNKQKPMLQFQASKKINTKLFGIGDDWAKAKNGGNLEFKQVHVAMKALGAGQTRFPGGAVSNYWDIEKAYIPTLEKSEGVKCPAKGWSGFTKADVGKTIKIKKKKAEVAGVPRDIPWGEDFKARAKVKDCEGTIESVDEQPNGLVKVSDGATIANPGATPPCTCETMVCPKKTLSMCMIRMQADDQIKATGDQNHFSLENFLKNIVAADPLTQMPIIVLNVVTMPMERTKAIIKWLSENLTALRAVAGTDRAKSEPILIEIGNEFYLDSMYGCKLGSDATEYVNRLKDLVPYIREHLPKDTRIGIVGFADSMNVGGGSSGIMKWNEQLRDSGILKDIDGITLHDYSLNKNIATPSGNKDIFGRELTQSERESAEAAWGAASGEIQQQNFVRKGVFSGKTAWITEYGVLGKNFGKSAFLSSTRLSGVHGLFVLGKLLTAVLHSDVFESLEYFNLGWADFGEARMLNMEQVLSNKGAAPARAMINGDAQMFAHVSSLAMRATSMHGVKVVSGPRLSFKFEKFKEKKPARCIQACMFVNAEIASVVIINRCQLEIKVPVEISSSIGRCKAGEKCEVKAWLYPTRPNDGEWTPLPDEPEKLPWNAPLKPNEITLKLVEGTAEVPAPPLSLSIVTFKH